MANIFGKTFFSSWNKEKNVCFWDSWRYPLIIYLATDDGACVIPQDCEIKDFTESRSYMETTIAGDVTSINHGNSLDFACKENRTLSESKDPDGDGLFNVVCYNGVLERQYLWPESNEVHTI